MPCLRHMPPFVWPQYVSRYYMGALPLLARIARTHGVALNERMLLRLSQMWHTHCIRLAAHVRGGNINVVYGFVWLPRFRLLLILFSYWITCLIYYLPYFTSLSYFTLRAGRVSCRYHFILTSERVPLAGQRYGVFILIIDRPTQPVQRRLQDDDRDRVALTWAHHRR
ncbi:hypothetical protein F5I97DRAFT_62095 [Phlebopus sp. FC_14]|nr:hypothetical protein F5I97DRAFT_62095 [Phlebopus sp. FC_14]